MRPSGYTTQITYRFLDQTWVWDIAAKGEHADLMPGGPLGAEGILRRVGENRTVVAAMGIIDWWNHGRQAALVST